MPLLLLIPLLIIFIVHRQKPKKMAEITTKVELNAQGFYMKDNKITSATVTDVSADDSTANGLKINNTVQLTDGSTEVIDEANIWANPQDLVNDLLKQFNASQPVAPAAAPAANS